MYHEFASLLAESGSKLSAAAATGNSASFMVGRLSYTFGLTGPCVSTDTACSSSLVAVHLGMRSMLTDDATAALAAGANLMLSPTTTAAICQLQALSPVGRCKTFEASADGYGRGEGFAALLLAPQRSAQALAVVTATAVNQDGRSSSLTAPNGLSQTALVAHTLQHAELLAAQLAYVALHGTGTPLGDPIETSALGSALGNTAPAGQEGDTRPIVLGSIKTCYGHTEGSAGLTGLLLAASAVTKTASAPFMHLCTTNAYVQGALAEWSAERHRIPAVPRVHGAASVLGSPACMAGASSFGMSGVNAHAIVAAAQGAEVSAVATNTAEGSRLLHSTRIWPLPPLSCLLGKPLMNATTVLYECHLTVAKAAPLWERTIFGRATLPPAAILETMIASAAAANISLDKQGLTDVAFAEICLSAGIENVWAFCEVDSASGGVRVNCGSAPGSSAQINFASMTHTDLQGGETSKYYYQSLNILLPAPRSVNLVGFLELPVPGSRVLSGCLCQPQHIESASLLATALRSVQSTSVIVGCSAFNPPASALSEFAFGGAGSVALGSRLHVGTSVEGIVSRSLTLKRRDEILFDVDSPAWQLVWRPRELAIQGTVSHARWITFSTQPCPVNMLCSPQQDIVRALNVQWRTSSTSDCNPISEIIVSSEEHVDWLMRCCTAHHYLFVAPPSLATTDENRFGVETTVEAMLVMYRGVTRSPRPIKASLITFDGVHVSPDVSVVRPFAGLLEGIARTLFMEDRSKHLPSVDLSHSFNGSANISMNSLLDVMHQNGEFAVAVRGGRTYSLCLARAEESRPRVSVIRSAFVAGGTKVRRCTT